MAIKDPFVTFDPKDPKWILDVKKIEEDILAKMKTANLSGPAGEELESKTDYIRGKLIAVYPELRDCNYEVISELVNLNATFRGQYNRLDAEWNALAQVPSFMANSLTEAEAKQLQEKRAKIAYEQREKAIKIETAALRFKQDRESAERDFEQKVSSIYNDKIVFIAEYPAEALPVSLCLSYIQFESKLKANLPITVTEEVKQEMNRSRRFYLRELLYNFQSKLFSVAQEGGSVLDYVRGLGVDINLFPIDARVTI